MRRMKTKSISIVISVFLAGLLSLSIIQVSASVPTTTYTCVTKIYVSDDSGATLAIDDAINPGTGLPHYGPTSWQGAVYAWGPTNGSGWFWNQLLHPSDYKTELLDSGANWIWKPTGTSGISLPDGRIIYKITSEEAITGDIVKFKRGFEIPPNAFNIEGTLLIAADNALYVYVNEDFTGTPILQENFYTGYNYANFRNSSTGFTIEGSVEEPGTPPYPWSTIHSIDISSELSAGTNTLEIVGINEHGKPSNLGTPTENPTGVMYKLEVSYCLPECGYKGRTVGFWKTNIAKALGVCKGKQQVSTEAILGCLEDITTRYGSSYRWLNFSRGTDRCKLYKAHLILSFYHRARCMKYKAQGQTLALLLTVCHFDCATTPINVPWYNYGETHSVNQWITIIFQEYDSKNFETAKDLADFLNNWDG